MRITKRVFLLAEVTIYLKKMQREKLPCLANGSNNLPPVASKEKNGSLLVANLILIVLCAFTQCVRDGRYFLPPSTEVFQVQLAFYRVI